MCWECIRPFPDWFPTELTTEPINCLCVSVVQYKQIKLQPLNTGHLQVKLQACVLFTHVITQLQNGVTALHFNSLEPLMAVWLQTPALGFKADVKKMGTLLPVYQDTDLQSFEVFLSMHLICDAYRHTGELCASISYTSPGEPPNLIRTKANFSAA